MKKYLLILFIISYAVQANFDLLIGGNGRSYPGFGGAAYLKAGYNIPLFGEISTTNPWYSMLRIQSELNTSGVVYHTDSQILFYPLSFIALGAGRKEMTSNYVEFNFYNCEIIRCEGALNKDYYLAKTALSFSKILLSFEYKVSRISYSDEDETGLAPGEYEFTLATNPGHEISHKRMYFAGYNAGSSLLGLYGNYIDFHESNKFFSEHYFIYRYRLGNFDTVLGGGNLYSSDQKPGPTAIIQMNYRFFTNNAIF